LVSNQVTNRKNTSPPKRPRPDRPDSDPKGRPSRRHAPGWWIAPFALIGLLLWWGLWKLVQYLFF